MSNVFTISAKTILSNAEGYDTDLLYLGLFFFNSHYSAIVITDITEFGGVDQIQDALHALGRTAHIHGLGYYAVELDTRSIDRERIDIALAADSPCHKLTMVIQKRSNIVPGMFANARFDIRFMSESNPLTHHESGDFTYPEVFYETQEMDKSQSYAVISDDRYGARLIGGDVANALINSGLAAYFICLSKMGRELKDGVIRFTDDGGVFPSKLFLQLTAEALRYGIELTGVVYAAPIEIPENNKPVAGAGSFGLTRLGIKFKYDQLWFPNAVDIITEKVHRSSFTYVRVDHNDFVLMAQ